MLCGHVFAALHLELTCGRADRQPRCLDVYACVLTGVDHTLTRVPAFILLCVQVELECTLEGSGA